MSKSIDIAVAMINRSVDLATENDDPRYYMDYIKLHKLMYLGQCYLLSQYNMRLFEENIEAHDDGPHVDGIVGIPGFCGFDKIKAKIMDDDKVGTCILPLSYFRNETVDIILAKYGILSTWDIVALVKETCAYEIYEGNPIISCNAMIATGKMLFHA